MICHATHYHDATSRPGLVAAHATALRGRTVLLTSRAGRTLRAVVGDYCPLPGRVDLDGADFDRLFGRRGRARQPRGGWPVSVRVVGPVKQVRAKRRRRVVVRLGTASIEERRQAR